MQAQRERLNIASVSPVCIRHPRSIRAWPQKQLRRPTHYASRREAHSAERLFPPLRTRQVVSADPPVAQTQNGERNVRMRPFPRTDEPARISNLLARIPSSTLGRQPAFLHRAATVAPGSPSGCEHCPRPFVLPPVLSRLRRARAAPTRSVTWRYSRNWWCKTRGFRAGCLASGLPTPTTRLVAASSTRRLHPTRAEPDSLAHDAAFGHRVFGGNGRVYDGPVIDPREVENMFPKLEVGGATQDDRAGDGHFGH